MEAIDANETQVSDIFWFSLENFKEWKFKKEFLIVFFFNFVFHKSRPVRTLYVNSQSLIVYLHLFNNKEFQIYISKNCYPNTAVSWQVLLCFLLYSEFCFLSIKLHAHFRLYSTVNPVKVDRNSNE